MGASQSATKTNAPKSPNVSSVNKSNNKPNNNTKKNNGAPVVWNGKVLPPATPAGQKSNINSNWTPNKKTRKNRK